MGVWTQQGSQKKAIDRGHRSDQLTSLFSRKLQCPRKPLLVTHYYFLTVCSVDVWCWWAVLVFFSLSLKSPETLWQQRVALRDEIQSKVQQKTGREAEEIGVQATRLIRYFFISPVNGVVPSLTWIKSWISGASLQTPLFQRHCFLHPTIFSVCRWVLTRWDILGDVFNRFARTVQLLFLQSQNTFAKS